MSPCPAYSAAKAWKLCAGKGLSTSRFVLFVWKCLAASSKKLAAAPCAARGRKQLSLRESRVAALITVRGQAARCHISGGQPIWAGVGRVS